MPATQVRYLSTTEDHYEWWDENNGEEGGLIFALSGDDWVEGDAGDDILYGDDGKDILIGGSFNDDDFFAIIRLPGYWGNDYFSGGNDNDLMIGGSGNDIFEGGDGSDSMNGGGGNDKFYPGLDLYSDFASGEGGDDIFYEEGNGFSTFSGDSGSDWVWFDSAVIVDLLHEEVNTGIAFHSKYSGVENLHGSFGDDTFLGTNTIAGDNGFLIVDGKNILEGGAGNDTLYGRGDNDILRGGNGDDNLFGGEGADWIDGGADSDTANYQDAPTGVTVDFIYPGSNTGYAQGDQYASVEHLIGSQFADGLGGDDNSNIVLGGGGNDFIGGRGGNDSLWGESGDDTLGGDAGADDLHGGPGNDWAIYWYAPSRVLADLLFPGLNTREVNDANGDTYDQIENLGGSQFDDHLGGDDLANIIFGLNGHDLIAGRGGADQLYGEIGNDTLIGDAGDDTLVGGAGNNTLDGGADIDTAVFSGPRSAYTFKNFGGGKVQISGPDGVDTLIGIERVQFNDATLSVPATLFDPLAFKLAAFAPGAGGWINQARYPREVADVNGDGFGDIVGFGDAGAFVSLGSASGFGSIDHRLAAFGFNNGGWSSQDRYPRHLADVNGDGRADIVGFGDAGVFVSLATGGGSFGPVTHRLAAFGAVNGGWFSDDRYHRELADVNGDGMADIVGFGDAGVFVSLATGGGTFGPATHRLAAFGTINGGWNSQNTYPRHLADVNGDGKADIVGFGDAGAYVSLATGNGNFGPLSFGLAAFGRNNGWYSDNVYPRELADVNGDGKADIVGFGDAGAWVGVANGDGTFQPITLDLLSFGTYNGWSSESTYPRVLADINHDHVADIVGFGQAGVFASLSSGFHLI